MERELRIYIAEDDGGVIDTLRDFIEDQGLGEVVGSSEDDGGDALQIAALQPDLILIDFLMPGRDGAELVRCLREKGCRAKCIMLSQVTQKDMIAKAYDAGIDFFLNKPINIVELRAVIGTVVRQLENERTIEALRRVLFSGQPAAPQDTDEESRRKINNILASVGMAGEKGSADILNLCLFVKREQKSLQQESIRELCSELSNNPKSMEQRMRRAIAVGLTNLAHLGLEDFLNESFTRYGSTLFRFEEVRAEMDLIRGKKDYGGKPSIKKFIESLMQLAEQNG
nr:response regulator [uncultured Stomatobaculum sp.]